MYVLLLKPALYSYTMNSPILSPPPSQASPSSETQGRSVGPGEKARRKFSSMGGRAPGYRLSPDHFQTAKRMHWFLIGHKKCFVLLCPIGERHLLSSFRGFVHDGYYLATVARFVHQAFLWPETKELPMSRKTFRMLSAGADLHWENSVSDGSQCIVNIRKFKMKRRRESKKRNSLTRQNNNFARLSRLFVHFFAITVRLPRENS